MNKGQLPVVLLLGAKSQLQPLKEIPKELSRLKSIFKNQRKYPPDFEVDYEPYFTQEQLKVKLSQLAGRVAILHFAGHSDAKGLITDNGAVYSHHIANIISTWSQPPSLIFLNGCDNAGQVKLLHQAGVPLVIATQRQVNDVQAAEFARTFYSSLFSRQGRIPIKTAFERASSQTLLTESREARSIDFEGFDADKNVAWDWSLFPAEPESVNWDIHTLLHQFSPDNLGEQSKSLVTKELSPRNWVWRCTDKSLENNQVSVLSLLETACALALYYFLAQHFQHHWWLLLTAFATPIILLRSEKSVNLGVRLLRQYSNREQNVPRLEKIIIIALSALISFSVCSSIHWLIGTQGAEIYYSLIVATIALAVTVTATRDVAIAFLAASIGAVVGTFFGTDSLYNIIGAFIAIVGFAGVFATVSDSTDAIAEAKAIADVYSDKGVDKSVDKSDDVNRYLDHIRDVNFRIAHGAHYDYSSRNAPLTSNYRTPQSEGGFYFFLLMPFTGLGIWLRSLIIRVWATLRYPLAGLSNLPRNWYRISACMDFTYPPELLYKATEVSEQFSLVGILKGLSSRNARDKFIAITLAPIWYIPALSWRWSLKATLWVWWPLALLLKQPLNSDNLYEIRQAVVTIVSGWWKWLLIPVVIVIPWLVSGYYSGTGELKDVLVNYAVPPIYSLRYIAIWLACILSIIVWWQANRMKSQFPMIIGDETYIFDIEAGTKYRQIRAGFYQQAKTIAKWHTLRIISFILLGYSYILYLANHLYPEQASHFIADWLIPHL